MKRKIKVLFVITRATQSGPIRVIENIIKYIDCNKYELYLISIEPELPERSILSTFKNEFREYQYIPVSKQNALSGKIGRVRAAIKKIDPDVVHSNGIVPDLIISRICPEKQLIIAHANYHIDYTYLLGNKFKGELLARFHIYIMKKAKTCIACSESLSEIYKKDHLDIPFIRNGVPVSSLKQSNKSKLREELGLPLDKKIFIYAASFNSRKNQKFLVSAFEKKLRQYVLLLLGDGPTYDAVRELSHTENILFLGRKLDVQPYLQASDYFISSSLQEGMPMGVLEGMSVGLPVVLSDIDQHRELFHICTGIGVLYKSESEDSLIKQIEKLVNMDYEYISLAAYKTVLTDFNSEVMSYKYQEQYSLIAASKN